MEVLLQIADCSWDETIKVYSPHSQIPSPQPPPSLPPPSNLSWRTSSRFVFSTNLSSRRVSGIVTKSRFFRQHRHCVFRLDRSFCVNTHHTLCGSYSKYFLNWKDVKEAAWMLLCFSCPSQYFSHLASAAILWEGAKFLRASAWLCAVERCCRTTASCVGLPIETR